jgi:exodeoxyribonuclease VII large subunit
MVNDEFVLSVSDFVAVLNQTMEYAYPTVSISGELANFRVSKNKWVYFDLKDDYSSVKFFATVYQLPGPLEDGLMLQVRGVPRLHNQFGFSVNVQSMKPVGEGSLKKAAALLEAKLAAEGLFDPARKRPLPYPPRRIGLVASSESAAYHDFIKILNARWGGIDIELIDVQVQGEIAPNQIVMAVEHFNTHAEPVDVLVITRGGGSPEDLAAFSTEQVTRAVAGSRIPTVVAIGHEVDISLAELAADQRASTPSNAAELLVPDKRHVLSSLKVTKLHLGESLLRQVDSKKQMLVNRLGELQALAEGLVRRSSQKLEAAQILLEALSPEAALKRGYAVIRLEDGTVLRSGKGVLPDQLLTIQLVDAVIETKVKRVQ